MKRCRKCGEEKSEEAFARRAATCRKCNSGYYARYYRENRHKWPKRKRTQQSKDAERLWREANPETVAAYAKRYLLANREKIAARGRQRYLENRETLRPINAQSARLWRKENRVKYLQAARLAAIRRTGLSGLEAYEALLAQQGGRCAICGTATPNGQGRFHVDHDHSCCVGGRSCGECIRGLLCHSCNTMLGLAKDDPALLQRAAQYLLDRGRKESVA